MKIELLICLKENLILFFYIDIFQYIDNILDQIFIGWNIFFVLFVILQENNKLLFN